MYLVYTHTNNSAQVKFQQAHFIDLLFLIPEAVSAMYRQPQHERKAILIGSHYFCQLTCISRRVYTASEIPSLIRVFPKLCYC